MYPEVHTEPELCLTMAVDQNGRSYGIRVYFLRPIHPMERPHIGHRHRRISRMNLSALCALLVRHSILFFKVHYRSGLSLVAVMPFALFPVDGYMIAKSFIFECDGLVTLFLLGVVEGRFV